MFVMGRASDPHQQLQRALDRRSFEDALLMARRLPISLNDAARLTTLASPRHRRTGPRTFGARESDYLLTAYRLR